MKLLLLLKLNKQETMLRPHVMNLMGMEILKPSLLRPTLNTTILKHKLQLLPTPKMMLRVTETILVIFTQL